MMFKEDFFAQKEIKKLRKMAGGDTYVIIYLKLQLLSLKNNGKIFFDGVEDTLGKELSLELDEDEENVNTTLAFLNRHGLIESISDNTFFMNAVPELISMESSSAERVRRFRNKQKQALLNANNEVV